MKRTQINLVLAGLLLAGGFVTNAFADTNDSASASASAMVVTPVTIEKDANGDLSFGKIAPPANGTGTGTVVIAADTGARTKTGNVQLISGGGEQAASFTVIGEAALTYTVTLPSTPTTLNSNLNTMTVEAFTMKNSGTLTDGTDKLKVGATLNVGAAQASGTYTGSFNVQVAYN